MADQGPQNLKTHRKFVPFYHYVLPLILLLQLVRTIWSLYRGPGLIRLLDLAVAVALIGIWLYARVFSLKVQDRVIRLEERLRLRELLPAELKGRISELTADHLIGLRFASDEELPDLVKRVLAGELQGREAIKKEIRNWRADHFRA